MKYHLILCHLIISLDGLNSLQDIAEGKFSEHEEKIVDIVQTERRERKI